MANYIEIEKMKEIVNKGFEKADVRKPYTNIPYPYFESQASCIAQEFLNAGYVNIIDFINWLKNSKYLEQFSTDDWYCFAIKSEKLDEAVQEYLGGLQK